MIRALIALALITAGSPAPAETLVSTRAIPAMAVIGPGDVTLGPGAVPGAARFAEQVIGQEARVTLYPGRPILLSDVAPPALLERNAVVQLLFRKGALTIATEGRTLSRARIGEVIPVLNLTSRATVRGRVTASGTVEVAR